MDEHHSSIDENSFETITNKCAEYFSAKANNTPCSMAIELMKSPDIPMHNFAHHYLVSAILLTAACRADGQSVEKYSTMIAEAKKRAKNVLPAFCGLYGACGAAVGVGIFFSIFTETTPLTKETWGKCNMATALALTKMAEVGGPRCCKRNTFIALLRGSEFIRDNLGIDLGTDEKVECSFSRFNKECLEQNCLFYKA